MRVGRVDSAIFIVMHRWNVFSRFSMNSEANASEFIENLEAEISRSSTYHYMYIAITIIRFPRVMLLGELWVKHGCCHSNMPFAEGHFYSFQKTSSKRWKMLLFPFCVHINHRIRSVTVFICIQIQIVTSSDNPFNLFRTIVFCIYYLLSVFRRYLPEKKTIFKTSPGYYMHSIDCLSVKYLRTLYNIIYNKAGRK